MPAPAQPTAPAELSPGEVVLVGAGPGDPELLTRKAQRALEQAEVVLHDRLVDTRILALAGAAAMRVEVGKSPGGSGWPQAAINAAMVRFAREGRRVVRLKSGDPLLFGRADEEMDALEAAGIRYAVIPGISSAMAAAAAARTSLTRRERNSALSFLTARDTRGYAEHDWRYLARPGATFAIFMGVGAARFVQGRLLLHGAAATTPVSVVENASRPDERVLTGELGCLDALLRAHAVGGPAVILIGLAARAGTAQSLPGAALRLAAGH